MKRAIILLSFFNLFLSNNLKSECVLVPLSLSERTSAATLIIEARTGVKMSYWNSDQSMIYTATELQVSRIYKGAGLLQSASINLITLGGQVGDKAVKVDPELEVESGEIGIFMLVNKNGEWVSESGPQGFIRVDKYTGEAADVFNTYPAFSIANAIESLTRTPAVDINTLLTKVHVSTKRASPTIASITPLTVTAGTSSVITIKGTNFGSKRDTNTVQFRNADDGGASFVPGMKYDYMLWNDTMIKLIVRTKAGTGKIRVVAGANGVVTSTDTLKITYAHLNVVSGDSIGWGTREIGMNSNNGITWKMNKQFYDSSGARGAFVRSLERWRCGTYINWDTLGHVNHSSIKFDGTNMCAWDTSSAMPSGVLAQCFSFWAGCFSPGIKWYVNELDIRFRVKPTSSTQWNYTTGNATSSQFHFESVAVHELGHGHQMGHVINSAVVMHYAIGNGQTKPGLTANDIAGGTYVITKSDTAICGKNAHAKLNSGNCAIVAPNSNFTMSKNIICKNEAVTFTDSSQGNISAYSWDFGTGASPATASTKGPHNVSYSSGGTKTVTLTITTLNGPTIKSKTISVKADSKMVPNFTYTAAEKGKVTFTNTSNNPVTSKWYFGDSDSASTTNPLHQYTSGGTFNITLKATNTCNTEDTILPIKFAYLNFYARPTSACILEPVTYFDSSSAGALSIASWQWTFTGGTPSTATGAGPHKVTYNASGNKSASLQVNVSGGPNQAYTISNIVNVGTDTFVKASFVYGNYGKNLIGFANHSTGSNNQYKWYFGDGDSSGAKDPIHQYTNANIQTVRLVVKGDCNTDDTIIKLKDFTSINALTMDQMQVFPNPASGFIFVGPANGNILQVELFDMQGRLVLSGAYNQGSKIDVSSLKAGLYNVCISLNGTRQNRLVFIQD